MDKSTAVIFQKLLFFLAIFLFSTNLQASENSIDIDFFYITGEVTTATGPGVRCNTVVVENLVITLETGVDAVLNNDNFITSHPDCQYGFSLPPNDTLYETELVFEDPGMYDAFFYILGATANATPVGPCPFNLTVTDQSSNAKEAKLSDVAVFPNPTTKALKMEYSNYQFERLELFNSNGAIVRREAAAVRELDVSHLSNGVYFLKIYFEEGVVNRKVLKE